MKKRRTLISISVGALFILCLLILPHIIAQVDEKTDQEAQDQLRSILKGWQLIEAVAPSDKEQAVALMAKFNQIEQIRNKFRRLDRSNFSRLKELANNEVSDIEEKKKLLAEYRKNQWQYMEDRGHLYEEILELLDIDQQIKFVIFDRTFRRGLKNTLNALSKLKEMESANEGK